MTDNTEDEGVLQFDEIKLVGPLADSLSTITEMSKPEKVSSGVFAWGVSDVIASHDGQTEGAALAQSDLLDVFSQLDVAQSLRAKLPDADTVMARAREITARGQVPIAVADISYDILAKSFTDRVAAGFKNDTAFETPAEIESVLEQRRFFGAAAILDPISDGLQILDPVYYGSSVEFLIDRNLIFTNSPDNLDSIEIDFDDGEGFQRIEFGTGIAITYSKSGPKTIRLRAGMGGRQHNTAFAFQVQGPGANAVWKKWTTISGGKYKDGKEYTAAAKYKSRLGLPFKAPILYCTGFGGVYAAAPEFCLPQENNLVDELVNVGFDVIEIDFKLNGGYIQGNANVVIAGIKKVLENSIPGAPLAVMGYSMGGLVTHYALGLMETEGRAEPQIRTWLSYDAPQGGATIPLGAQMFSLFFESQSSLAKSEAKKLRSPAAKQMLIYHVGDRYNEKGEHPLVIQERKDFAADLRRVGYPTTLRKLAVSNGRGDGKGLGYKPHTRTLNWHGNACVYAQVWGNADRSKKYELYTKAYCIKVDWASEWTYKCKKARYYDGAPGGTGTHNKTVAEGAKNIKKGSVESKHPINNYIPSISGADIPTSDPYYNIAAGSLSSPFDSVYYSPDNTPHVSSSAGIVQWIVKELEQALA